MILLVPPEGISEFTMAQRQGQGPHNGNWDTDFIPFFNTGTVNSPGVSSLSSNNNGHGHFTSANSNSFPAQEAHNSSSRTHQDHTLPTPFSINPVNGTNSRLEHQGKELLEILLKEVSPTAQKIQEDMKNEVMPGLNKEIEGLRMEVKQLRGLVAEMEVRYKDLGNKIWTQLSRQQQEYQ
jgi:hypothetical protein